MRQYLENGTRATTSIVARLTGSCICAFDWQQNHWPWWSWTANFLGISRDVADLGGNFGRQQRLNDWRWTHIVSDRM